jgi:hypothetical protein
MQRIADLVRLNHSRYVVGQISIDKAGFFAAKMDLNYGCFSDKVTNHRTRLKGLCTSRLLFLHMEGSTQLDWILMLTPGEWQTPHRGREKWLDPTESRITLTGYELVRHIRAGNSKPSWTWRYNARRHDDIRDAIVLSIRRHNTQELTKWIDTIWRSPAFAGVREQVKKFAALIRAEWTRSGVGEMPDLPKGLGYIRRLPDKGKALSKLKKELEDGTN